MQVQQRWPDSPLLWLRDVAQYLNFALVTSQEEELCKEALGGEPLSALTANMRKVIAAMLSRCEEGMRETFFETCVANTAHELAKGGNVAGWRCLTQLLADLQPTVVTAHLPRYVELRNSYQNRLLLNLKKCNHCVEQACCGPCHPLVCWPGREKESAVWHKRLEFLTVSSLMD